MTELVPLKIKIELHPGGGAKYPDMNRCLSAIGTNGDWSHFVDQWGGWIYDKRYGHRDAGDDSPRGVQWGVVIVPEEFAQHAETLFPHQCETITESDLGRFYESRVSYNEPDTIDDLEALQLIKVKRDLGAATDADVQAAIDPDNDARGISRNKRKRWQDFKALRGVEISAAAVQRRRNSRRP